VSRRQKNENYEKNKSEKKRKKKERNLLRWRENFFSFGTHFQSTTFYDERMRRERERERKRHLNGQTALANDE